MGCPHSSHVAQSIQADLFPNAATATACLFTADLVAHYNSKLFSLKPVAQREIKLKQNTETVSFCFSQHANKDVNEAETMPKPFQCFVSGMCGRLK